MKKLNNRRGFTMAEMLIVVAITLVLSGVLINNILGRQRALARMERDSVAKEIFISAQNHLTMAKSQGYLGLKEEDGDFGENVTLTEDGSKDLYYIVRGGKGQKMLDLMLPEGAIDGTVRNGGSYVICYYKDSGIVRDVFYCSEEGTQFGHNLLSGTETINSLMGAWHEDVTQRTKYNPGSDRSVLGWYGGAEAKSMEIVDTLKAPMIEVVNAEMLYVKVTDSNPADIYLQLIVKGVTSGAEKLYTLRGGETAEDPRVHVAAGSNEYYVVLDDITTPKLSFANLEGDAGTSFIPGEDITVQAKVFDVSKLNKIKESAQKTTNSLYAQIDAYEIFEGGSSGSNTRAYIDNMRHLENLHKEISNVNTAKLNKVLYGAVENDAALSKAEQTKDLDWNDFCTNAVALKNGELKTGSTTVEKINVYKFNEESSKTPDDYYYPVSPDYDLVYDGMRHSISNVTTVWSGPAGLFGKSETGVKLEVDNLDLIDFSITSNDNDAGALGGTLANASVSNVLAHHTLYISGNQNKMGAVIGVTANGNAGGLIGTMTGGTSLQDVEKSAAALLVESESESGSAGGLIGSAGSVVVKASYSGGHIIGDEATGVKFGYDPENYNVTAKAEAGGLIGKASNATIEYCYSTCSAKGETAAGGFVGTADDKCTIKNCYCTGLVSGPATAMGAFAGCDALNAENCQYFESINEVEQTKAVSQTNDEGVTTTVQVHAGYKSLPPLTTEESLASTTITSLDKDAATYQAFCGSPDQWQKAVPYHQQLAIYYQNKYNLKTVAQLGATVDDGKTVVDDETVQQGPGDYVIAHYGDWPPPEVFTLNKISDTTGTPGTTDPAGPGGSDS